MAAEQIRILRVEGRAVGMDVVTTSLDKVSGAANRVAAASEGMTAAQTRTESKTVSMSKAFETAQTRLDMQYRVMQQVAREQLTLDRARDQGITSLSRYNELTALNNARLNDNTTASIHSTKAVGLNAAGFQNLGYQINDIVTGLASGQSPFMIIAQQGGQVQQILSAGQGGIAGSLKSIGSAISSMITPGRLAFGGLAAGAIAAGAAVNTYLEAQQRVAMALTGAGRASGASITGITGVANRAASPTGLSVSEARELAAALAATGKVANDNILPIVKMGKDVAHAFGVDAAGAVELLTKSFSDPVAGADTLNQRLGFLDAAMQSNLKNLTAQNRAWEAQKVLTAAVRDSLADVNGAVNTSTKFWTALGNMISNAWDKVGEGASRVTGIGLKLGLEEQLKNAQERLEELQKIASRRSDSVNVGLGTTAQITEQQKKIDELTAALQRYSQASVDAQQRQRSFAQAAGVKAQLPEIEQITALRNANELLVTTMIDVQATGGASSPILQRMGRTYEELAAAIAVVVSRGRDLKNEFTTQLDALKTANAAISAFSPGQKGEIARRQSLESTANSVMSDPQKQAIAAQAQANAIKQVTVALSEAARVRLVTANQSVAAAQLDIDMVGRSIAQQTEMRANLAARQQLEQQASANRTLVNGKLSAADEAELDRLKKINAELGRKAQLAAIASVNDNIKFDRSTVFLTPEDVQIAQQLRSIYPNVADGLNSVQAQQMRVNNALRAMNDLAQDVNRSMFVDFAQGLRNGMTAWDAFKNAGVNALGRIADKLMQMAADNLWASAFGGSSGGGLLGGIASLFGLGGGGGASAGGYAMSSGLGAGTGGLSFPMFAGGTNFAPGGPSIINEGGMGEIVDLPTGARVIPHDVSMEMARASANENGGVTVNEGDTYVTVQGDANEKTLATMQAELAKRDRLRRANFLVDYRAAKTGRLI